MKDWKKMISFLSIICILAGGITGLAGQITDNMTDADVDPPQVTFVNEKKDLPDLYVTKHVESTSSEYPAPADDLFSFVLKVDGKLADEEEYTLYDSDGKQLTSATGSFRTDRYGTFTLQAEQTARFEYVGTNVHYEVTELPREGYQQILPAGGTSASGNMPSDGAVVEFSNLYIPKGTGTVTDLVVQKNIIFPAGYTPPESPDFTFVVEVSNKPYNNEPFTILDLKTGKELGTDSTDAGGSFKLKGGTSAVFKDLPTDVDYRVYEDTANMPDGWRSVGETKQEGSLQAPVTNAIFNNVSASFVVTKTMEDRSRPDTEFEFLLTDGNYQVKEAAYYLYDILKEEQVETKEEQPLRSVDGIFKLKPGQAAIFVGIDTGTKYNVSEIANPSYEQKLPVSINGYTEQEVKDNVETLSFVNAPVSGQTLNVSKVVENTGDDVPFNQEEEFSFILYRQSDDGITYTPVTDRSYKIQTDTAVESHTPGADGVFKLKANQTARFEGMPTGVYWIKEITPENDEYQPKPETAVENPNRVDVTEAAGTVLAENTAYLQSGTLVQEGFLNFIFTNQYTAKKLDLTLVKKDGDSQSALEGAVFKLYRDEKLTNPVVSEDGSEAFTTNAEGTVTIAGLKAGTYWLAEDRPPSGYILLTEPVKVELKRESGEFTMLLDDGRPDAKVIVAGKITQSGDLAAVSLTVYNNKLYELPSAGGMGIHWYWIGGTLLMLAAVLILYKNRYRAE